MGSAYRGESAYRGVCLWGSVCLVALWKGRPPCGQTDSCENITLPQLRLRVVNILGYL